MTYYTVCPDCGYKLFKVGNGLSSDKEQAKKLSKRIHKDAMTALVTGQGDKPLPPCG